jgi:hypothetical protein
MATLAGGAVGGAAIQSVLGPLFGQVHERRELRSKMLDALAAVEQDRWASSEDRTAFRTGVVRLRSTALMAGVSRDLVDIYVLSAAACYNRSLRSWEESGGDPEGGSIPIPLSDYVRHCGEALRSYAWHSHVRRLMLPYTKYQLRTFKAKLDEELAREPIPWDNVWLPG